MHFVAASVLGISEEGKWGKKCHERAAQMEAWMEKLCVDVLVKLKPDI